MAKDQNEIREAAATRVLRHIQEQVKEAREEKRVLRDEIGTLTIKKKELEAELIRLERKTKS